MQKKTSSLKDKIKMLFCVKVPIQPTIYKKKQPRDNPIKKQLRQTFNINHLFFKLSRKNIIKQTLFTYLHVINPQLEKHLSNKITGCSAAIIRGQFTSETTNNIDITIYLTNKPIKVIPFRQQIKTNSFLKVRNNVIDLVLYQTNNTILKNMSKKNNVIINQNGSKSPTTNQNYPTNQIQQQKKQILTIIKTYAGTVNNIIIITSKMIELKQLNQQLIQYGKQYLFQLQNIRQNQQLICNVIYISKSAHFLKINDKAFKKYIILQMNLNKQQQQIISTMLDQLIQSNYHRQIVYVLRNLKISKINQHQTLLQSFIINICKQNQEIKQIIQKFKSSINNIQDISQTPSLFRQTPIFQIAQNCQTIYQNQDQT